MRPFLARYFREEICFEAGRRWGFATRNFPCNPTTYAAFYVRSHAMPITLEYHIEVRQLSSPAIAFLTFLAAVVFVPLASVAQINAPPSSVTSPGFGGRPVNGPPPSVTSVGPRGYVPKTTVPLRPPVDNGRHHHRRDNNTGPYWYAYPVPYEVDSNAYADAPDVNNDDADNQGGPTVFDRRGSGERSYIPPIQDVAPAHPEDLSDQPTSTSALAPAPSTMLVFKDGHSLEIGNYAIVGTTLFDLTPGHPRRVPLADLDLDATKKENDDRGVNFEIPSSLGS
jgi:hypothetical protein